jgi:hypothetical protein
VIHIKPLMCLSFPCCFLFQEIFFCVNITLVIVLLLKDKESTVGEMAEHDSSTHINQQINLRPQLLNEMCNASHLINS